MKDVVAKLNDEDFERYRVSRDKLQTLESGAVSMPFDDAMEIVRHDRELITEFHETYELDEDEFHVFDAVTGTISLDKAE